MRSEDIPELADYLSANGGKWLSREIQNEILALISRNILKSILEENTFAFFWTKLQMLADSNKYPPVSELSRKYSRLWSISLDFTILYMVQQQILSSMWSKMYLQDFILTWAIEEGNVTTVLQICRVTKMAWKPKLFQSRALFVHCNAHNLNLVVQDAISEVPWTRQYIGITREMIEFIRDSPSFAVLMNQITR